MTEAEKNRLIVAHMGDVASVAAKFRGADIEYEDLIGVGRLGLTKAADDFVGEESGFRAYAYGRIQTEISNALRSGHYAKGVDELSDSESFDHLASNMIYELWPDHFDGAPDSLTELYDDIRDKQEKFDAAFISLTPMERKAVQLVYLRDPPMSIVEAARETRVSYLRTWRALERALRKMRKIIVSMESNSGALRANGVPPKQTHHGYTSGTVAA